MLQLVVEFSAQFRSIVPIRRQVEMYDLSAGMHSRIGPAAADYFTVNIQRIEGGFQFAADGLGSGGLSLEAPEKITVIGYYSFDPHQKNLLTLR